VGFGVRRLWLEKNSNKDEVDYPKGMGSSAPGKGNNDVVTDHWFAISSRVTDLKTGNQSYQFFDPETQNREEIREHSNNSFSLKSGKLIGKIFYRCTTYTVTQVGRN